MIVSVWLHLRCNMYAYTQRWQTKCAHRATTTCFAPRCPEGCRWNLAVGLDEDAKWTAELESWVRVSWIQHRSVVRTSSLCAKHFCPVRNSDRTLNTTSLQDHWEQRGASAGDRKFSNTWKLAEVLWETYVMEFAPETLPRVRPAEVPDEKVKWMIGEMISCVWYGQNIHLKRIASFHWGSHY